VTANNRTSKSAVVARWKKCEIPLRLRDFQVEWESPVVGLFHVAAFSTALLPINSATEPNFNTLSDNPSQERQAVVTRVLSNREEGLGPEADFYLTYWVEAHELPETEAPTTLVFERGNDGNVYLDGRLVSITLLK